jgi:hypothetical protein
LGGDQGHGAFGEVAAFADVASIVGFGRDRVGQLVTDVDGAGPGKDRADRGGDLLCRPFGDGGLMLRSS